MNIKLLWSWLLPCLCFYVSASYSQQIWEAQFNSLTQITVSDAPKEYEILKLNQENLTSLLTNVQERGSNKYFAPIISLPLGKQNFEKFEIYEASNFSPALARKFPSIKSYIAKSTVSNTTARISYSKQLGLFAYIETNEGTIMVKPVNNAKNEYITYHRTSSETFTNFECETIENTLGRIQHSKDTSLALNDGYLRKYRVAIATTGEYASFFLTGHETSDQEKKETVLAAMNNSLTRINGIFERDFGVIMELIDTNDQIIYLNGSSDPFSSGGYNGQLQSTLNSVIGSQNYDVGHLFVFSSSIYGNAGCIACVCEEDKKGSAFTAHSAPDSDHFNMIASHEFGHQFGGYHVQSSANCRSSAGRQEVEPGSGSSIMGYAGICPPNVQSNPDDYFNYVDIRDVIEWTRNNSSCAELISTGNNDPIANAGGDYTIPISTAFVLEGTGSDSDSNSTLTYCWEQNNPENPFSTSTPQPTWVYGPLYRSKPPTDTPNRYIPRIEDVIQGNLTPTWEVIPSVSRTINFVLTVRDNAISGAKTASDEKIITVIDSAGPFTVTSQNTSENWTIGETRTITWDVANTHLQPIGVENVQILLSIDGGYTYPYILANSTPNNGSAQIIIPALSESTSHARIMVRPLNNIFYAINTADIYIQTTDFVMDFTSVEKEVCKPNSVTYNFTYKTFLNFNESTNFSVENLPNNVAATFSPSSALQNNTPVTLTLSGTDNLPIGTTNFIVKGNANSIERQSLLTLNTFEQQLVAPTQSTPQNNAVGIGILPEFSWNSDINAANYSIEIATDQNFNTIIESVNTVNTSYASTLVSEYNTTYYWRIKSFNSCAESNYSSVYSFTTACNTVTDIQTTPGTDTVEVQWIDNSGTSSWEIEIVNTGTTPTGMGTIVTNNPYTAPNLTSGSSYNLYIRALCSSNNFGDWVGPISFSTLADYCNGDKFFDPGLDDPYSDNQRVETLIHPNNADLVEVIFESFDLESGYDYLTVYDGNSTNAPVLGTYTGRNSPGILRSKIGQGLTFVFSSDSSVVRNGWEATVNCITITCPEPTDFVYTSLTSDTVNLTWNVAGSETQWEIEYGVKDFILGQGTKVLSDTNPKEIGSLTPNTTYDFYLKAVCGATPNEDDSFTVGPLSLKTPCGIFEAPYFNGAEEQLVGNIITNCWEGIPEVNQDNFFWTSNSSRYYNNNVSPNSAHEGSTYFRTYFYGNTNTSNEAILLMPTINIDNLTKPTLHFYSFMLEEGLGNLYVDVYHNNQWTLSVFELQGKQQATYTDFWGEHYIDLSQFSGEIQVRFRATANANSQNEIDIDAIEIYEKPECPNPTQITYSNLTHNSVDLNWTSQEENALWNIEYGTRGFTPGYGTTVTIDTIPYTLTNLPSNTELDLYVQANCNDTMGNLIGPIRIKTSCAPVIAPWYYDVEDQSVYSPIQHCWEAYNSHNNYLWRNGSSTFYNNNTGPYQAHSGNTYFKATSNYTPLNTEVATLVTPVIDVSQLTSPMLNFFSFMHGESVGSLHVDLLYEDNWIEDIFVLNGQQQTSSKDYWKEHFVDLSLYTNEIQIRFRAIPTGNNNLNEINLDDISIIEKPNCIPPTNLTFTSIESNSVQINWTSNNGENNWIVSYGDQNFTPGTGTEIAVSNPPFTLDGLNPNSIYDVYIKAACSSDNESNWSGPYLLKTLPDYCAGDRFYDSGGASGNYANSENYTTTITPTEGMDFVTVIFEYLDLESCCDYLSIYDGPDVNAPLIGNFNGSSNPGTISSTHNTGALTFKFHSDGSVVRRGWEATVLCETLSCAMPLDLSINNIVFNAATVNWTPRGTATNWIIEYGLTGFTQGNGQTVQSNTSSFNLSDLASDTEYDVHLKTDCGNGNSTNSITASFKTLPNYCAGDHFYDSGGANNTYTNNEYYTTTIYPSEGMDLVTAIFNTFELDSGSDYLSIYDGDEITNSNLIGSFTGVNSPGIISATNPSGALTFRFYSNGYYAGNGWDATILCENNNCAIPIQLESNNITNSTADISWIPRGTASNWIIEYGPEGFTPGNGLLVESASSNKTLNNLNSNTTYDVYIKTDCGNGATSTSAILSFQTLPDYCQGDYFYDTGGSNGNYRNNEYYVKTLYPSLGYDFISVTFNYFSTEGCCDYLHIYDGPDTNATLIGTYNGNNSPGTIISTHETGALTFVFSSDGSVVSQGWEAAIHCNRISCPEPTNVQLQEITNNTATYQWSAGSNEQQWQVEYGLEGFEQGTNSTKVTVNNNSYTFEQLQSSTTYQFYLRAVCGTNPDEDDSSWIGPFNFQTPCSSVSAPFYENFSANSTPNCWTETGSESWVFNTYADYEATSAGDFTPEGNTNYAWIDGSSPNGTNHISNLKTLPINISNLSSPTLEFAVFSKNTYSNSYNTLQVKVHTNNGTSFNVFQLQGPTQNGNWETISINLNEYPINSSNIQIEFSIEENAYSDPYYNDILIDDISVDNNSTLSTDDVYTLNGLKVYPNPVINELTINTSENFITKLQVYSVLGKMLWQNNNVSINTNHTVDFSNLPTGIYILKVFSDEKQKSFRIIKQ